MKSLQELQEWMLTMITHPQGIAADPFAPELNIRETADWSATERLGIYGNAYYARLQECLRDEYPVLRDMLGEEAFDEFSFDYLQQHPSTSYTLGRLGAQFPAFLAATRPPRVDETKVDWADFLTDLTAFEWMLSEVFDGPGDEGTPMLASTDMLSIPADRIHDATFGCAASLRLGHFRYPVPAYHAVVNAGEDSKLPAPLPTYVAVIRQDYIVKHYTMDATEWALLSHLQTGESLGEALAAVCPDDDHAAANTVGAHIAGWFARWTRYGFLRRMLACGA